MTTAKPLHYLIRQERARRAQLAKDAEAKRVTLQDALDRFAYELALEGDQLSGLGIRLERRGADLLLEFSTGSVSLSVNENGKYTLASTIDDKSTEHKSIESVKARLALLLA